MEAFVIVVAHGKGGVGKTSTAINIAVELQREYQVKIIDFDNLQQFSKFNSNREKKFEMLDVKDDKELRKLIENSADITVIDLGGYDSALGRMALMLADLVITPLNDSDNEMDGLMQFAKTMKAIRNVREDLKATILVNRIHHANKTTHAAFKKFALESNMFNIFETVIRNRADHTRMLGHGKSVCEKAQFSKSCLEVKQLMEEIEEIING